MNDIITKLGDCQRSNVRTPAQAVPLSDACTLASPAPLVVMRALDTIEKGLFSEGGCKSKKGRKRFGLVRNHEDTMGRLVT